MTAVVHEHVTVTVVSPYSDQLPDSALQHVATCWRHADPSNERAAAIIRATYDQLYDGQHTGRYRWDQLYKTEKTHFGTLLEINLRREFTDVIDDGVLLDYRIASIDIDCKYSQNDGGWMIPPEAIGQLLLVATADDSAGTWSLGMVRASSEHLRAGRNRDNKTGLNLDGRQAITWLARYAPLPPNVLLALPQATIDRIFAPKSGQARVNELLRCVVNRRIGRNTVATLAQQDDFMARVRGSSSGARKQLRREGLLIPGGDYLVHRRVAEALGAAVPAPGEIVSVRVVPASPGDQNVVELDNRRWRLAREDEPVTEPAPLLPTTKRQKPVT